jgi:hypothetical protein
MATTSPSPSVASRSQNSSLIAKRTPDRCASRPGYWRLSSPTKSCSVGASFDREHDWRSFPRCSRNPAKYRTSTVTPPDYNSVVAYASISVLPTGYPSGGSTAYERARISNSTKS